MCKSDGLRPGELDCLAYCIFKTTTQVKYSILLLLKLSYCLKKQLKNRVKKYGHRCFNFTFFGDGCENSLRRIKFVQKIES